MVTHPQGFSLNLHQCVKAFWKGKVVTIPATKVPYDEFKTNYFEASLYEGLAPFGKNKILHIKVTPLPKWEELKIEEQYEQYKLARKVARITEPDDKVVYELWRSSKVGKVVLPNLAINVKELKEVLHAEELKAPDCMEDEVKNVQGELQEENIGMPRQSRPMKIKKNLLRKKCEDW